MDDAIKDNTNTIKNMDSVHFIGQMEESISETGKMVNSMVEDNTTSQVDKKRLVNGFKARK
jgi:hypothetical protein